MEWTRRHDTLLFREILVVNPFQSKKKTTQRAKLWQGIAMNLKEMEDPKFKDTLSKRSVQDRCYLLCEKYRKRMNCEKKASGISPELTELDVLIEETIEKEEVSEETRLTQGVEEQRKMEVDRVNAVDMRKKAMETLRETNKRKVDAGEEVEKKRKRRRSGNETMEFIRQQTENEFKMREREIEVEKEHQAREEEKHNDWKDIMARQMANQEQQMNQFQMMMLQQNTLIVSMLDKITSSNK